MRIHLRKRSGSISKKKLAKGRKKMVSLYLAYQAPKQKTKYEWLKLYVFETPYTNLEKEHNKETIQLAEAIRAKRLLSLQSTRNGFASSELGKIDFLDYFKRMTEKKYDESEGNQGSWKSTYEHLKVYIGRNNYSLGEIDEAFLEGFKEYLFKNVRRRGVGKLNTNSALSYFNKVRASMKEAFRNKMIKENPCDRVKCIKAADTHREFLVFEELQKLLSTECENPLLKKAFLFSALTGLRWSDVKALKWHMIRYSESEGWSIQFQQKKTKKIETLPVAEQAIKFLGNKNEDCTEIFKSLCYHSWMNTQLQNWVTNAGIAKKITFHCARHSFATLQLSINTDIYTVSKLLGHRHLKTTEIYAKAIDKKKVEAAKRIPELI